MKSGLRYGIKLTRYIRMQGQPYRVLHFALNDNNLKGKFVFSQEPQPSAEALSFISGFGLPLGKILPDTIRIQTEASSQNINRATFRTLFNDYSERIELIFDRSKQQVISYRLLDGGFAEIDSSVAKSVNGDASTYYTRPAVREMK